MLRRISISRGKLMVVILLLATMLFPVASALAQTITIDMNGSTTVFPIMDVGRYQFPVLFPDTTFNIARTGSGAGKTAILNNATDIGLSSSSCKPGIDDLTTTFKCPQLTETRIARDALTIVVHKDKTCVTDISRTQLKGIYEGTITNWNAISASCPSQTIVPRARIVGSGTRQSFLDLTSTNDTLEQNTITATGLPRFLGNQEMEAAIGANTAGDMIGYVGLAFVDPNIKALSVEGVFPSAATVNDGSYKLSRSLFLYTLPPAIDPDGGKPRIADVLTWAQGYRGQGVVVNEGFIAIGPASPNWDVNVDFTANILDMSSVGTFFLQTAPGTGLPPPNDITRGWVRADVTYDGAVNILDLSTVGGQWLNTWTP